MKIRMLLISAVAVLVLTTSCNKQPGTTEMVFADQADVSQASQTGLEDSRAGDGTHATIKLTKADFLAKVMNYEVNTEEWVFEGDKPCVIDFYADWCAPCRMTSPILEELAVEYGDKINIYKIDTDREQELAAIFGIQSIPSFLFVPMDGQPMMSSGVAQSKEQTKIMFKQQIDELLLKEETL